MWNALTLMSGDLLWGGDALPISFGKNVFGRERPKPRSERTLKPTSGVFKIQQELMTARVTSIS